MDPTLQTIVTQLAHGGTKTFPMLLTFSLPYRIRQSQMAWDCFGGKAEQRVHGM